MFGIVHQFPIGVKKMLEDSWAPVFRKLVFEKIDEKRYAVLFSDVPSRPNFPVNIWVGLEIIKSMFDLTDEELLQHWHFDLLTAYALGQEGLGELTLSMRTIYYNRERLLEYENKTGRNLLEEEFHALSGEAIKAFSLDTTVQRMDTTFVGSYIKQMSRLELVVKVLQNFYKDLPEEEQEQWKPQLNEYLEEEAQHLSYRLKRLEVEGHLKKLGEWLFKLHQRYADEATLTGRKSYQHMGRVLNELFKVTLSPEKTVIEMKKADELSASSLQNPADDTATYRVKGGEAHVGHIAGIAETCTPGNPLQIVTDIAVYPNTQADEAIAGERVPEIKQRMEISEIITDAGFTGETSERVCAEEGVTLIPTEILGPKLSEEKLSLKDFHFASNEIIACPALQEPLNITHKDKTGRRIIRFSHDQCTNCPLVKKCPVIERKQYCSLSVTDRQLVLARRRQQLEQEGYKEKCHMRPAVEGTISLFKRITKNDKLRVHSLHRVSAVIIAAAIGINFKRIWAYLVKKQKEERQSQASQGVIAAFYRFIFTLFFGLRQLWGNHTCYCRIYYSF